MPSQYPYRLGEGQTLRAVLAGGNAVMPFLTQAVALVAGSGPVKAYVLHLTTEPFDELAALRRINIVSSRPFSIINGPERWRGLTGIEQNLDAANLVIVPGGNAARFGRLRQRFSRPGQPLDNILAPYLLKPGTVILGNSLGAIAFGEYHRTADMASGKNLSLKTPTSTGS